MAEPAREWTDEPEEAPATPTTPIEVYAPRTLDQQVRNVATQRGLLGDLESVLRTKHQAFTDSNTDLMTQIDGLKKEVQDGEEVLKIMAIARHEETGEVQIAPGVKIRRTTQVDYDPGAAIEWCKAHEEAAECIKLNTTKFNALAKNLTLPFVNKETVSQVTLAKDLTAALKAEAA